MRTHRSGTDGSGPHLWQRNASDVAQGDGAASAMKDFNPVKGAAKAQAAVKAAILRDRGRPKLRLVPSAPAPRKDRIRPAAKPSPRIKWACRPKGRNHQGEQGSKPAMLFRPMYPEEAVLRRIVLADTQGRMCALCAGHVPADEKGSLDHVVPLYLGGWDEFGNYLFAHRDCNIAKANDEPTGCELVWLFAVNARLGVFPVQW